MSFLRWISLTRLAIVSGGATAAQRTQKLAELPAAPELLDSLDERFTSLWIGYDEEYKAKKVDEFVMLLVDQVCECLTLAADETVAQRRQAKEEQEGILPMSKKLLPVSSN